MPKTYHFISGLPRSGSTLLSAILKQNPRFTSGISDPLQGYAHSIIKETGNSVGMEAAVPIEKRRQLIRGLFDSFYQDSNEVCFNTNRGWTSDTPLLKDLFPNFKMIVCLRDIPWILDSFERLNSKNPYTIKPLYHHQQLTNVYDRSNMLMGGYQGMHGYVIGPIENVKHSIFCAERDHILYVEYDTLVANPLGTMQQIYRFLGEPWFDHDFDNVEDSYDEFDEQAKIEGLHTVRKKVEFQPRDIALPGDVIRQHGVNTFWKTDEFNEIKKNLNWVTLNPSQPALRIPATIQQPHQQL